MTIALSPAELVAGTRASGGVAIPSLPPARIERAYVNDEARLEIKAFPPPKLALLKSLGCFTEIINYKTRLFVPTNRAVAVLTAIEQALDHSGPYVG
ncbi:MULTISPECIES: hypothetical protein [unclassified Sphingobium]|uniref:hypothetical protein n=1 Tax=unclassified Sphingobium TaxID=2611147 RepID=UPI0035A572CC